MLSDLKIRFRLLCNDEREPTTRQRCLRLLPEFKRRGLNVDVWDGHENCDVLIMQYFPYDVGNNLAYCDYLICDCNDAVFMPEHPDAKVFWENFDFIDYWATGSKRIEQHLAKRSNDKIVSYVHEIVDPMYHKTHADTGQDINNILCMGFTDNIVFVKPLIPVLNKLHAAGHKFKLIAVYPRLNSRGEDNEDVLSSAKFKYEFIEWSPDNICKAIKKSTIGITPLYNNEWSRGKSANKAATMMWCSLPVIAQDIESYHEVIEHGNSGLLASNPAQWEECFIKMFDKQNRIKYVQNGTENVKSIFTVSAVVSEWEEIFGKVVL